MLSDEKEIIIDVPFILLLDLNMDEEKSEFVTINNSQKGVPKPLTSYLLNSIEARISWELNTDQQSPFYTRITRTKLEKRHLYRLNSFEKQMKALFRFGILNELEIDVKIDIAINYFRLIATFYHMNGLILRSLMIQNRPVENLLNLSYWNLQA